MVVTDAVMMLLVPTEKVYMLRMVIIYSYIMPVSSKVKLLTRGAMGDLMHYCTRPNAEGNSASALHSTSG